MEMPKVVSCNVIECAYNQNDQCHAMAVNVGEEKPVCGTFYESSQKCTGMEASAGVGACKMDDCIYNDCLMCAADSIEVEWQDENAKCLTFKRR